MKKIVSKIATAVDEGATALNFFSNLIRSFVDLPMVYLVKMEEDNGRREMNNFIRQAYSIRGFGPTRFNRPD